MPLLCANLSFAAKEYKQCIHKNLILMDGFISVVNFAIGAIANHNYQEIIIAIKNVRIFS